MGILESILTLIAVVIAMVVGAIPFEIITKLMEAREKTKHHK